ncbi:MAG: hypothetical protein U1E78_05135 [Gammaproteobacteria bacterium]
MFILKVIRIFYITALMISGLILINCQSGENEQFIEKSKLQNVEVDHVIKLSDLLEKKNGTLCVLYPYQETLSIEVPFSKKINSYLENIKYFSDEDRWSLIYLDQDKISISTFKRSQKLDILSPHETQLPYDGKLLKDMKPAKASCISIDQAVVMKTEIKGRIFLLFGESSEL